jgi:histone acetyltransferase (RNA polymerase elongator complex component)
VKKVTVPFFISHQGCPHTCVFCDQRIISGASGDLPNRGEIRAKIEQWRRSAGERPLEVAFFGGTFTALPVSVQNQLLDPLQPLLASRDISSVRISTRPDCIDADVVGRLAQRGVATIEIGVQSMDDEVLERSGRGHTAADSEAAICCIVAGGLTAGAQLMPGLPGDTSATSLNSLKRVIAVGASFVRLYPVVVLRGTELAKRYLAGEFRPMSVNEGVKLCKILLHETLQAGVDCIRIGLQPDDGLNHDTVLAGCWHPALGQLTRSELYFDLLCRLLKELKDDSPVSVYCHPSRVADVTGHGRINLKQLEYRLMPTSVRTDSSLLPDEIVINGLGQTIKGSIITSLNYTLPEE